MRLSIDVGGTFTDLVLIAADQHVGWISADRARRATIDAAGTAALGLEAAPY